MSAGYLPHLTKQVITLQADSVSIPLFDTLVGAQDSLREVVYLDGILTLPSLGKSYVLTKGVLTRIHADTPGQESAGTRHVRNYVEHRPACSGDRLMAAGRAS
jgi:hypothetical protein